jgi:cytochrome d ubiquinol oxidase subunit I
MAYEVMSAFFLEAGFLGVMLFGLDRVGKRLHYIATLAVALGTFISAFWILAANSWMQTPAGYGLNENGQFIALDWLAVIFNPSFPYRLVHMVLACYLTTALVVGAVAAFHMLRGRSNPAVRIMFSMAMGMITVVAPLQILAGDAHGLNTLEHQPVKIMAMEGHYHSHPDGAPLILFGMPNQEKGDVDYAIEIPKLSSLVLKHDPDAPMAGLDTIPRADWPYVPVLFWSFRIMVALGMAMGLLAGWSVLARLRDKLYDSPWLHRLALLMGPAGFVAVLCGWITTEVGRQPYTIYGLLRTDHSASPLAGPAVAISLAAFAVVYFAVFSAGVFYILRLMGKEPHPGETGPEELGPIRTAGHFPVLAEGAAE